MYIREEFHSTSFNDFKKYDRGSQINFNNLLLTVYGKLHISRKAAGNIFAEVVLK